MQKPVIFELDHLSSQDWDSIPKTALSTFKDIILCTKKHVGEDLIPSKVIVDNDPDSVSAAVSTDAVHLDVPLLNWFTAVQITAILVHKSSHIEHDDVRVGMALGRLNQFTMVASYMKDLHDESAESFTGLVLKKYGNMENFESFLVSVRGRFNEFETTIHETGLNIKDSFPDQVALSVINNEVLRQNLTGLKDAIPCDQADPHAYDKTDSVYKRGLNFVGEKIQPSAKTC